MATPVEPPHTRRLLTVASVLVLIGVEVFGVALAAGWALAGIFELGEHVGYGLMGLFSLMACYVMLLVWRRAHAVEAGTAH